MAVSTLYLDKTTPNRDRRFGSTTTYVPARVFRADGTSVVCLLTEGAIQAAVTRGDANPEDVRAFLAEERRDNIIAVTAISTAALLAVAAIAWCAL